MARLEPVRKVPKFIQGASVAPATIKNVAKQLGISEEDALKTIEGIVGGPVEIVVPTEPFIVVVTNYPATPESRRVTCSLCQCECWAGDDHGPLATYLCMGCAEAGALDDPAPKA